MPSSFCDKWKVKLPDCSLRRPSGGNIICQKCRQILADATKSCVTDEECTDNVEGSQFSLGALDRLVGRVCEMKIPTLVRPIVEASQSEVISRYRKPMKPLAWLKPMGTSMF